MIRRVMDTFTLASSLQALRASKLTAARKKLDAVLSRSKIDFDFIVAFDALMMVMEDRHDEARNRFRECLEGLPSERNNDEEYISLFCRFYLSSYAKNPNVDELRESAIGLGARETVQRFLRFPSPDAVRTFQGT